MLSVREISRSADGRRLVHGVSADFRLGELNLIIGPNGAGKSTLIKLLSKQLKADTGSIAYDSIDLGAIGHRELARIRAVLSQNIELSFPMRVWEVVMMGRYPHFSGKPGASDARACQEVMDFFQIADRNYLTLSGGEKQRVHFARVIAQIWFRVPGKSRYLFLDEPLTFLDVYFQFEFMGKLRELLDLLHLRVANSRRVLATFGTGDSVRQRFLLRGGGMVVCVVE